MRWNTTKLWKQLNVSLFFFILFLIQYKRLFFHFLLPSCLSFPYSCRFLADSEWHLTFSLIRMSKGRFCNFVDLRWGHGRDHFGFLKWHSFLKILFAKQVRNMIASLLIRMNIIAVSSRCHKLYGYRRNLTWEHTFLSFIQCTITDFSILACLPH